MARCEDHPCCGHGDHCPRTDSKGNTRWACVQCFKTLPLNATSSLCATCLRRLAREGYNKYNSIDGGYKCT